MTDPRTIGATIGGLAILGLLFIEIADGVMRAAGLTGIWEMM